MAAAVEAQDELNRLAREDPYAFIRVISEQVSARLQTVAFTHEDVRLLRSLSREAYDGSLPGGDRSRMLASLADRIAALLPPEVT